VALTGKLLTRVNFALDKFGIMGLTRRRELNPVGNPKIQRYLIFLQGVKVLAVILIGF